MLPKCPHCNEQATVYLKLQVIGWARHLYDAEGLPVEMSLGNLSTGRTGLIRCSNCHEVRKDLVVVESRIVPKE